jgi:TRAP-type C4-dicarboxylate transport system permease small subunit
VFGIVFIVFSGLAAIINYELYTTLYSSAAPATLFEMSILTAMLPFLVSAVLSFSVAALISRTIKSEAEKEKETQKTETKTKQEAELEGIYK